ncbi:MAG: hypothetical protein B6U97_01340 [Candidatus Altiarchaeales archaeon ex4484_96]|nr:MAG: hypothetical protein B6U97_01340 [Candidatus Altiarchaeales archaeon ex4484_96]
MSENRVPVKFSTRIGEYNPTGRFKFPHQDFIYAILESTSVEEQKKHDFYFFNNILVSRKYSDEAKNFIQRGARKAGFEIEFINE